MSLHVRSVQRFNVYWIKRPNRKESCFIVYFLFVFQINKKWRQISPRDVQIKTNSASSGGRAKCDGPSPWNVIEIYPANHTD